MSGCFCGTSSALQRYEGVKCSRRLCRRVLFQLHMIKAPSDPMGAFLSAPPPERNAAVTPTTLILGDVQATLEGPKSIAARDISRYAKKRGTEPAQNPALGWEMSRPGCIHSGSLGGS